MPNLNRMAKKKWKYFVELCDESRFSKSKGSIDNSSIN